MWSSITLQAAISNIIPKNNALNINRAHKDNQIKKQSTFQKRLTPLLSNIHLPNSFLDSTAVYNKIHATMPVIIPSNDRKVAIISPHTVGLLQAIVNFWRSEERHVGKECRSRWSP